jgi:hypothetical protein
VITHLRSDAMRARHIEAIVKEVKEIWEQLRKLNSNADGSKPWYPMDPMVPKIAGK